MRRVSALALSSVGVVHGLRTERRGQLPTILNDRAGAEEFTVFFQEGTTRAEIDAWCGGQCNILGHPDEGGLAFASVSGRERVEAMMAKRSAAVDVVEVGEMDYMIPDEDAGEVAPLTRRSWGLIETGVEERASFGRGVHIYVHDTGVRVSHQDFGGRGSSYLDYTSGSEVECNGSPTCAVDRQGHGTHCAGTAGGTEFGLASEASVYATKTLSDAGSGQRAWNIAGIDFVTAKGAKPAVISLSLGGPGQDAGYKRAIETATRAGVIVVVAAGNFGSDSCGYSPAFVPDAITVGATEPGGRRAGYSNFGTCNDIMAPGSGITSASHRDDRSSTSMTGTSMACPHVSGAAAVFLSQNPWWKRAEVVARLESHGRKDYVFRLGEGDPDLFLWAGKDPAPGEPVCPDFASRPEPNYWGECECPTGQFCSVTGGPTRDCPSAWGLGGFSGREFTYGCKECRCY